MACDTTALYIGQKAIDIAANEVQKWLDKLDTLDLFSCIDLPSKTRVNVNVAVGNRVRKLHFSNTRKESGKIHCLRGFPRGGINRVF